jgi:DNA-directed RNA polymerase beta' subunit
MNISQPVASHINSVSFSFLTSEDVRALSAKRITSATTFDTLLNPVPGGLYSPELGQFGDNACATCGLKNPQCAGHCGHIELPVPCYHPTFMDQTLKLLRAACIYCGKLKMGRVQVQRYLCKLRLVKYGLLKEVEDLDDLAVRAVHAKGADKPGCADGDESESDDDHAGSKEVLQRLGRFVKVAINTAKKNGTLSTVKTEAQTTMRKRIVSEFMGKVHVSKKCSNCQGVNHTVRQGPLCNDPERPQGQGPGS